MAMTPRKTKNIPNNDSWPTMGAASLQNNNNAGLSSSIVNSGSSHQMSPSSPPSSPPPPPPSCHCNFYLWSPLSYIKYHTVHHQARLHTYEGLGGKKFVRIPPGSLLEKWYPQKALLKEDGCCICGYGWKDHLEYWWWKKKKKIIKTTTGAKSTRGKLLDEYLDDSCKELAKQSRILLKKDDSSKNFGAKYSFHRNYVDEVTPSTTATTKNSDKHKQRGILFARKKDPYKGKEIRTCLSGGVSYLVTPINFHGNASSNKNYGTPNRSNKKELDDKGEGMHIGSALLLALARTAAILRVEDLIYFNEVEVFKEEYWNKT